MKRILVTGALGQIGSELVPYLRGIYGRENVIATDRRQENTAAFLPFERLDCLMRQEIEQLVEDQRIDTIIHLAALLSAVAEARPQEAWRINVDGLLNILETARKYHCAVFVPSSIGAFGPGTPRDGTPQDTIQRPTTMYGITKVTGELLCDYYHLKHRLDVRGLRFPGLISNVAPPGGGTTDYAVDIFYQAIKKRRYSCYLRPDSRLDMMYMPDALKAIVQLMEADPTRLRHRNAFNVTAMSFTPEELAAAIRRRLPDFVIEYQVDPVRQAIADSWPRSLDDSAARREWGWKPSWSMDAMIDDMLAVLGKRFSS
jgi:nucleoside-diphosphate-sugar epimerase